MDPRLGTDTSGPGEAVFAIRLIAKPQLLWKHINFRTRGKNQKNQKILLGPFFGNN